MGDFKINVVNQTGDGGLPPETVNFMLFQTVQNLEVESWTKAWKVAKIGYPGNVGPVPLPEKVEFYVIDETYGNPRHSGPTNVLFGQTYSVVQKDKDAAPEIQPTNETAPKGQIKIINARGNPKRLEMALFKNGKQLLSFKNVRPADAVFLSVEPSIYIADVDGSVIEGQDYKAVDQRAKAKRFQLFPEKPDVTILLKKLPSGEITFEEAP